MTTAEWTFYLEQASILEGLHRVFERCRTSDFHRDGFVNTDSQIRVYLQRR